MILQLLKRDPAWKMAPYLILILAVAGWFAEVGHSIVVMPIAMSMVATITSASQSQQGLTGYLSALPITKYQIVLSRTSAMVALIWLPTLGAAALCTLTARYGAGTFIALASLATPLALAHQSLLIREIRLPVWATSAFVGMLSAVMLISMARFTGVWRLPVVPILATSTTVSAAILLSTWIAIPSLGVPAPLAAPQTGVRALPAEGRKFPWWLFWWWDLVWFAVLFNMTFSGPWFSSLLFLWVGPIQARERYRFLDSLPVSRRLLLAARIVPMLIAMTGGYLTGVLVGWGSGFNSWAKVYITAGRGWPPTAVDSSCATLNVVPPLDYWRPAAGGAAPLVQAPWGETYQLRVVRVHGFDVYNPYATGCHNTARFQDWQYERASMAVYGRLMPKNDAKVKARPRARTWILNVGAILTLALLVVFPILMIDWWRLQKLSKGVRRTVIWVYLGGVFGASVLPILIGFRDIIYLPSNAVQVLSWWLPDNMALVILLAAGAPCVIYWALQRVFLASEIVAWTAYAKPAGNYN
jgi:hypothetical protein